MDEREHVVTKDDGQTEKYWNPEWGDEGAAPDGVSRLLPEGEDAEVVAKGEDDYEPVVETPEVTP